MPEIPTEDNSKKSDFNEANFQILRLNNLWVAYHTFMATNNFFSAHKILESIWTELAEDARQKDKIYFMCIEQFNKWVNEFKNDLSRLEQVLKRKAIFLKGLQERVGKGGKKSKQLRKVM